MYQLILLSVFCASALAGGSRPLPSHFKKCKTSLPQSDYNECMKDAVQRGIVDMVKGEPSLEVGPIDPLRIPTLNINQGGNANVAINLEFKNCSIFGIGQAKIHSVDAKLKGDEKKLIVKASASHLKLEGPYTINGKVLILPISGVGIATINLDDTEVTIVLTGRLVTKNGVEYLVFRSAELTMKPKKCSFNFANLFNGDKTLGDNMNALLNEQWSVIWDDLEIAIERAFGATFAEVTNGIFAKVAFKDIFPA